MSSLFTSIDTSITNSDGVATCDTNITANSSFYSVFNGINGIQSKTSNIVNVEMKLILFYDSGVTGSANTNYTVKSGALHETTSTGTKIYSTTYSDGYYVANQVVTGDFEITYDIVEGGNIYYPDVALLDTSYSLKFATSYSHEDGGKQFSVSYNNGAEQKYETTINELSTWKIQRIGSTVKVWVDDNLMSSGTMVTSNVYFAWKTHTHSSRWFRFKDLEIIKI